MNLKKTQYAEHRKKIRSIEGKINRIENRNPDFDFKTASRLFYEIEKYVRQRNLLIYSMVDASMCKEKSHYKTCSTCNCWKVEAQREALEWKQKYK